MNFMNRVIVACCILLCTSVWKISAQDYPFRRADLPVEERVEDLVRRMTLEEKIDLLAGYTCFQIGGRTFGACFMGIVRQGDSLSVGIVFGGIME